MKFRTLEEFVQKLNKISGKNWKIRPVSLTDNETYLNDSIYKFTNCNKEAFEGFTRNKDLYLIDFKKFLTKHGSNLKLENINLNQEAILYCVDDKTNIEYSFYLERNFSFATKLQDGSLLIDNLKNFSWEFEFVSDYVANFRHIPGQAHIRMKIEPTINLLAHISNSPIQINEIDPLEEIDSDKFNYLVKLKNKAFNNIKNLKQLKRSKNEI